MAAPLKYPDELRERAVRMAVDSRKDPAMRSGALARIGGQLGINPEKAVQADLEARGITQLFELKRSARVLVSLSMRIRASHRRTTAASRTSGPADRTGASYQELELTGQHRSGGSDAYEAWVDALLEGRPITWTDQWRTTGCSLLVAPS